MKERQFDERWRQLVRAARNAAPTTQATQPPPEPADIVRGIPWRGRSAGNGSADGDPMEWWRWYGVRGLAVAGVVLAVCAWITIRGGGVDAPGLRPGVEDVVAEAFWLL